ncbi:MAG: putative DNA binding domain-containing protein [Candidatus Accumulibacter sp.]|uniref:ATP-binding protein n=1 Tax=Accumulibacter sp. TaxID=2053492 RepID=UPI00258C7709|nr:ATP-binding protein [Accumulibacter sp.]MCM8622880.1 putative DNA binding domain-containing protein [Accumulibacter sp.]
MTAQELLEHLNLLDENERIEAKRADEIGKSLLETVCAFANEPGLGGGWLLLGVTREELALFPAYEIQGLNHPDKVSADLASQAASMFNRPLRLDIQAEVLDGKTVIAVFVPEAAPQDKPLYLKAQGLPRGAFRRIGSTDQRCSEDDLIALYQVRQHESFDAGLVPDGTFDDFSPDALADYRQSRRDTNPDAEELRWSDEDLLQALGCVRLNADGKWQPTVAGLVLFGKPVALRSIFPMTRVDYIRVPGREWVPDPERRFDSLELRDPLFRLIRRVQAAILDDLPKAFGLAEGDLQRKDSPIVPQRVIREAVVNALMHRSYRSHASVQIIRYSNRLEIRNPGFSLKSPDHLGEPGSLPRNPKLAAALYDTRFAETKGSGVRVMREMCEKAGLAPPLFESDRGQDQFVVRLFFHHFLGPEDLAWLARFKNLHLSEAEARALVVAREVGAIDNATWRDINKVDTLTASQSLKKLRDAGLLQQKGRGSATWYQPTGKMLGDDDSLSSNPDGLSSNPLSLSRDLGALSRDPNSLDKAEAERKTKLRQTLLAGLPGELAARVGALGRRSPPDAVRDVVLDLLQQRPWRLEELGQLLQRNPEYVRQKYVQPLLEGARIRMTRPEVPNDPEQAYRAVEERP